jgi:hypothetical protein
MVIEAQFLLVLVVDGYWQTVPLIANEVGTALVTLFQVPLNPAPVYDAPAARLPL